jgi:hypothetical protein
VADKPVPHARLEQAWIQADELFVYLDAGNDEQSKPEQPPAVPDNPGVPLDDKAKAKLDGIWDATNGPRFLQ